MPSIRKAVRRILDALGGLRPGSNPPPRRVRRILIVRLDQIGDAILTLPLVAGLRRAYPDATIDWVVRPPVDSLLVPAMEPAVRVLPFPVSWDAEENRGARAYLTTFLEFWLRFGRRRYDLAIGPKSGDWRETLCLILTRARWRAAHDCAGLGFALSARLRPMPRGHVAEENAQALDILGIERRMHDVAFRVTDEARRRMRARLRRVHVEEPYAVIVPGSRCPSRIWPTDRFALVGRGLAERAGLAIVVTGSPPERPMTAELARAIGPSAVDLGGRFALGDLPALLTGASIFVGCDSGPGHIAGVLDRPVVVPASGNNESRRWHPLGSHVRVIEKEAPCKPCHLLVCPVPGHPCMTSIEAHEVLEEALALLDEVGSPVAVSDRESR